MPVTPSPDQGYLTFKILVGDLVRQVPRLPARVLRAEKTGDVATVFKNIPVSQEDGTWQAFNRRMDVLYGEDVRDEHGRLKNVQRGEHGMEKVVSYLQTIVSQQDKDFLWTAGIPKLVRLVDEVNFLIENAAVQGATPLATASAEQGQTSEGMTRINSVDEGDNDLDSDDATYNPPKRRRKEPQPPARVYDSDGKEIVEEVDKPVKPVNTKPSTSGRKAKEPPAHAKAKGKKAAKRKSAAKGSKRMHAEISSGGEENFDSGSESDGRSALHDVESAEAAKGARRGPPNKSLSHFHEPIAVEKDGQSRWQFGCRFCKTILTFKRTVTGKDITLDDEPTLPPLNNLSTHAKKCEGKAKGSDGSGGSEATLTARLNLQESAKLMESFLKEGELNPAVMPTYRGFLRLFSAWILDDSLPWTTGESPSLGLLFKYLRINFALPSDTTVRNQLARIFAELHGKVVREFAAVKSKIAYATDTWTQKQMIYSFAVHGVLQETPAPLTLFYTFRTLLEIAERMRTVNQTKYPLSSLL
ncbi:hypothetical protein DENSPDRAFT_851780 [Dentipellis sp. KUC8613]|nr:hypothetical protein DENSPDRAFT_851780 [Dentipellis sp. KUC8613]